MTTIKEELKEALKSGEESQEVAVRWQRLATEWRNIAMVRQDELVDIRSRLPLEEPNDSE